MTKEFIPPKVFISYSWKPAHNKEKVLTLANRLSGDAVHVILDDWDLTQGHDKYQFMEQMVNKEDVKRVLLICNKDYAEKANQKRGGVGIESMIVSDEIYSKAAQTKFIPVIFEYDSEGKPCSPTFVKNRIFVDLSNDEVFEENYEILLRNIFDKPASKRPPIGTPPAYITTDEPVFLRTAHKIATIRSAYINEKKNPEIFVQDYLDTFLLSLDDFVIDLKTITKDDFDEKVLASINDLLALRDDFTDFIETWIKYAPSIDIERLHRFFERLFEYFLKRELFYPYSSNTIGYMKDDNLRFFVFELFLIFTSIMIEKGKFSELAYILNNAYILEDKHGKIIEAPFYAFKIHLPAFEYRKNKRRLSSISLAADMIKQRAKTETNFRKLKEADTLLYYISLFQKRTDLTGYKSWFPETSVYSSFGMDVLPKSVSRKYFDKIKILFGVNTLEELMEKVEELYKTNTGYISDSFFTVRDIKAGLKISEMCTYN